MYQRKSYFKNDTLPNPENTQRYVERFLATFHFCQHLWKILYMNMYTCNVRVPSSTCTYFTMRNEIFYVSVKKIYRLDSYVDKIWIQCWNHKIWPAWICNLKIFSNKIWIQTKVKTYKFKHSSRYRYPVELTYCKIKSICVITSCKAVPYEPFMHISLPKKHTVAQCEHSGKVWTHCDSVKMT